MAALRASALSAECHVAHASIAQPIATERLRVAAWPSDRELVRPRRGATVVAQAKGGKGGGKKKGGGSVPKAGGKKAPEEGGAGAADDGRPPHSNSDVIMHSLELIDSFHRATGKRMFLEAVEVSAAAKALWDAPFIVMSHGVEDDPIFNYGNQCALTAFDCSWAEFTALPSRRSSPDPDSPSRKELLAEAEEKPKDLKGLVRTSTKGRLFEIDEGTLWTCIATDGERFGQAAVIRAWHFLDEEGAEGKEGEAGAAADKPQGEAAAAVVAADAETKEA